MAISNEGVAATTSRGTAVTGGVHEGSYVDWASIFAGAVLASAVSVVFVTFGSGIGLSMVSPEPGESVGLRWVTIAAGLWFIWVAVSSFAAGGYLAGRMRRRIGDTVGDEVETRDGAHGLMVWATGALVGIVLAFSGVTGLFSAGASAVGAGASGAAQIMEEPLDYYAGQVLRGETGVVSDNPQAREEVAAIMARSFANGELTDADRSYLAQIVASETELSQQDAEARIDTTITEAQGVWDEAVETADQVRIAGVIASFVIAATLLVSALAAYFAAITGGQHRDQNLAFRAFGR